MIEQSKAEDQARPTSHAPLRVRLPRFITDEQVGLET
jgi:hypothetical protein